MHDAASAISDPDFPAGQKFFVIADGNAAVESQHQFSDIIGLNASVPAML